MSVKAKGQTGFTIVELLIVIVVIGILAAISVVAYTGIQVRARDSIRSNDIAAIAKALDMYFIENGSYPASINPTGAASGWEMSHNVASGRVFMQTLGEYTSSQIPIDPSNSSSLYYQYISLNNGYTFSANSCTISRPFYVLQVTYESSANNPVPAGTASATCGGENGWVSTSTRRYIAPSQARI